MTDIILFAFVLIIYLLVISGIIGPKRWRSFIKEAYRWYYKDRREVIFPVDPDKPILQATKEGAKEIPERIRSGDWLPWNWSPIKPSHLAFFILQVVGLFVILYIFIKFVF